MEKEDSLKRPHPHEDDDKTGDGNNVSDGGPWQTVSSKRRRGKKSQKMPPEKSTNYPAITFNNTSRLQSKVTLDQLRNLILYIFADGVAPQWISVSQKPQFKKIVAVMVPGLEEAMFRQGVNFALYNEKAEQTEHKKTSPTSPDDYYPRVLRKEELPEVLQPLADVFKQLWPIKTGGSEKHGTLRSPLATFLASPHDKNTMQDVRWKDERTRITEFVASPEELVDNGYPLHPVHFGDAEGDKAFQPRDDWAYTRVDSLAAGDVPEEDIEQGCMTAGREVLAIDCEMCKTGEEDSLTRISVVSWDGSIVLDELVQPDKPITDYVTQWSGITEQMLAPVTTTLKDIQAKLLEIISAHTILVGHSLESDLTALKMAHPFIIDTALLFPHNRGPPLKNSLKAITQRYLKRNIQQGTSGHNSIEDAKACLELVKQKCLKGKRWGYTDQQGENFFRRLSRCGKAHGATGGQGATVGGQIGKTSAMIDWGDPSKGPGAAATFRVGCQSDEEVVEGVLRAIKGDAAGEEIPYGGVDFVFARFRELEALQGWWNRNRPNAPGFLPPPVIAEPVSDPATPSLDPAANDTAPCPLETCVEALTARIKRVHESLPPCTALIMFSGSGDPRAMGKLQSMQRQFKREYNTPGAKWGELSVKWTDTEDQALKKAVGMARDGIGFMCVR